MIKAAVGDDVDFTVTKKEVVATRLLALTPGIVKELPNFKKIQEDYDVLIEHHLNIGDEITPYRTNLDGCGYVVAKGDNLVTAAEKAEKVKKIIDEAIVR